MAEVSYPFDGQTNNEAEWWPMARLWAPDGVVFEGAPSITLGAGLSFVVPDGFEAYVRGTYYRNDGSLIKTASDNISSNPRYDQLLLRLDRTANTITAEIKEGTPAVSPDPPAVTQDDDTVWEIPLAYAWVPGEPTAQNYANLTLNHSWTGAVPHLGHAVTVKYGGVSTAGNVTSSAYTPDRSAGSPVRGTFVAPPSGRVSVALRCRMRDNASATAGLLMSYIIREGGTAGSGTPFQGADDNRAIQHSGTTDQGASIVDTVTGLEPGKTYNVEAVYRCTPGGNAIITAPWVSVTPLLA